MPTTYQGTVCNGADAGKTGPWATGSGASCYANQPSGHIFDLSGNVVQFTQGGNTPIPAGGAVLSATGGSAQKLDAEAPPGSRVAIRYVLSSDSVPFMFFNSSLTNAAA